MSGLRGVLAGSLSLIALQAVVGTQESATRVGSLATDVASLVERAVSPAVPLIPDRRAAAQGSTTNPSSLHGGSGVATLPDQQFTPPSTVPLPRPATPPPVIAPADPGLSA